MLNKKVVMYSPERFRIDSSKLSERGIIVKPNYLSICNADIRYYFGERPAEVLKKKLPMILIHEAVGKVVYSEDKDFNIDDNVCIVPISRNRSTLDEYNYDYPGSSFMSSSAEGCMQEYMSLTRENLVKFNKIKPEFATNVEVASVAMQAVKRIKNFYKRELKKVAVWGTGSVAFWTSLLMKEVFKEIEITIIGRSPRKLEAFNFVDKQILNEDLELKEEYDLVVEAVGSYGTEDVLKKSIKIVKPVGCILMLGVSEHNIYINTREWMEKGIMILTSHRSTYQDFYDVINLIESSNLIIDNINKGVSNIKEIRTLEDIHDSLNTARIYQFKTVMKWDIENIEK